MNIQRKGRQNDKGVRVNNRAHDSPEGERADYGRSGKTKPGEIEVIEDWLSSVRFKKAAFGGVSEADVWKKIAELNEMYETALTAERARYDMLLQAYEKRKRSEGAASRRRPADEGKETRDIPVGSRSRDAPKQTDTKVMKRTSTSSRKSAKPQGVPFTEVDWLDDEEDDWFNSDSGAPLSDKSPSSRSREGGL